MRGSCASIMSMPEAPMDENDDAAIAKDDVGRAGKVRAVRFKI